MPSNKFNASHPATKPPAYCWYRKIPLPPIIPPIFPMGLQGWARWTDLDPLGPFDLAIYCTCPRVGDSWQWMGEIAKGALKLRITLARLVDPQPWRIRLDKWVDGGSHELMFFPTFVMQLEPTWDTRLLTFTHLPGYDFRQARVTV